MAGSDSAGRGAVMNYEDDFEESAEDGEIDLGDCETCLNRVPADDLIDGKCPVCREAAALDAGSDLFGGEPEPVAGGPDIEERAPRRVDLNRLTAEETAIVNVIALVEAMGADVRLTDAVELLSAARDSVADYVDGLEVRRFVSVPDPPAGGAR